MSGKSKLTAEFKTFVSKSQAVNDILETVDRIAMTESSVLISGETGVGKELFAEQIHLRSPRKDAPFIRVNCAALPEGLLESELFGHVKGAFTSAISSRRGRFEAAHGGTIFLDEIADIPLRLQTKLLRIIQEKSFEKIGSDTTVNVNTRILAATNKDIESMVKKNLFRSDLYYRLNVLPLHIPPLRDRKDDIPELARFFLSEYNHVNRKKIVGFTDDADHALLAYSWPGNIRELRNCVERACVIGSGNWIKPEDLFLQSRKGNSQDTSKNLKTALNNFKAHYIRKVLEEYQWNQTETAKALEIQRTYLSRLIKEYNIKER